LEEKVKYLTHKINIYSKEKIELEGILESEKNSKVSELENEIRSYKTLANGYVKNCAKLTEEIVKLKADISKYLPNEKKKK
jgi:chromosome segregation ATPase